MQNGFKEHGSTNACTFMVKETIQYYLQNGSNVYGTVLDATKAFDRIDFCKLFREMIIRKIPPLVIRLIMEMYEKQSMAVRWNNEYSDSFGESNGVKQGGVLSPILFCIYIDNLLMSLKKNDIGWVYRIPFLWGIWVRGRHHAFKSKCKRPTKYVRLLQ